MVDIHSCADSRAQIYINKEKLERMQQQQQAAASQVQVQKTVADTYYQPTTYAHYDAGLLLSLRF